LIKSNQFALAAWLALFALTASVIVGALTLAMIGRLTEAQWYLAAQQRTERIAACAPLLAVLFLPIAAELDLVYPWAARPDPERAAFLNPTFFIARSALYVVTWSLLAALLPRRPRAVSAVGLPLLALTACFAGMDWLMSLEPEWSSAIFGIYFWSGGFLAALALVTRDGSDDAALPKLLLTASIFWGYIAWSQALIIWIAGVPREAAWLERRTTGPWAIVLASLVGAQLVLPFLALLTHSWKRRRGVLLAVRLLVLLGHALDMTWLVGPALVAKEASSS
jgi:hypothetical protein